MTPRHKKQILQGYWLYIIYKKIKQNPKHNCAGVLREFFLAG